MIIHGNDKAKVEFLKGLSHLLGPQSYEVGTNLWLVAKRLEELSNRSFNKIPQEEDTKKG